MATTTTTKPAAKSAPVRKPAAKKVAPAVAKPVPAAATSAPAPAAAKPVTPATPKPAAAASPKAAAAPAPKAPKPKKPKLVRDSYTIPKAEYAVLDGLKQRSAKLAMPAKKSELLRAGIKALAAMADAALVAALKAVPAIKTGRPAKD